MGLESFIFVNCEYSNSRGLILNLMTSVEIKTLHYDIQPQSENTAIHSQIRTVNGKK